MRLDLPPAFFLGVYLRLAMLGGVGLAVLGLGAALAPALPLVNRPPTNAYGVGQVIAGLALFVVHELWRRRAPVTEYEPFLRRAYFVLGGLAFLAGAAVFFPLGVARALTGDTALAELTVAAISLALAAVFAFALNAELARPHDGA